MSSRSDISKVGSCSECSICHIGSIPTVHRRVSIIGAAKTNWGCKWQTSMMSIDLAYSNTARDCHSHDSSDIEVELLAGQMMSDPWASCKIHDIHNL